MKIQNEPDGLNPELAPYVGHHILVKASGEQIERNSAEFQAAAKYIQYLTSIGISVILVAGGGGQITKYWNALNKWERPKGADGGNYTSTELLEHAVLPAERHIREEILALLPDVLFIEHSQIICEKIPELWEVGKPVKVEAAFPLDARVKVVTFVWSNAEKTEKYNVNADDITYEVSTVLWDTLAKVMFITGTGGILDASGNVVSFITQSGLASILEWKNKAVQVDGGMRKKALVVQKFVETGTPVVVTNFSDIQEELESTKGKGTLVVQDQQISLERWISLELLEKVYEEQVSAWNWKKRTLEELEGLAMTHYLASAHGIPLWGLSLLPFADGWHIIEALWAAETWCGLGKIIIREVIKEKQWPFFAYSKSAGFFLSLWFVPVDGQFSESWALLYKKS